MNTHKVNKKSAFLLFILLGLLFSVQTYAQDNGRDNSLIDSKQLDHKNLIFSEIEKGIVQSDVSKIANYLSAQTYLNLSNGVSGYYSSNQAYYVLEDFFKDYKITEFKFEQIVTDENTPYATGTYDYILDGKRNQAQVYVALKENRKQLENKSNQY